jgi:hypothetical protein
VLVAAPSPRSSASFRTGPATGTSSSRRSTGTPPGPRSRPKSSSCRSTTSPSRRPRKSSPRRIDRPRSTRKSMRPASRAAPSRLLVQRLRSGLSCGASLQHSLCHVRRCVGARCEARSCSPAAGSSASARSLQPGVRRRSNDGVRRRHSLKQLQRRAHRSVIVRVWHHIAPGAAHALLTARYQCARATRTTRILGVRHCFAIHLRRDRLLPRWYIRHSDDWRTRFFL